MRPQDPDDTGCDTVTGFRVMDQDQTSVTFSWDTQGKNLWEFSYGPVGVGPEGGTRTLMVSPFISLMELVPDQEYRGYVRGRCPDGTWSDWNAGIAFAVGGVPGTTGGLDALVDESTLVFPVPATTQLSLFSSFHIRTVDLYALDGRRVLCKGVHSLATRLDVSELPRGGYILRVHTAYGDVTRKILLR